MRNFSIFLLLLISIVVLSFPYSVCRAQNNSEVSQSSESITDDKLDKIQINGKNYTYGEIVADFLNSAFSETLWNEDDSTVYAALLNGLITRYPELEQEDVQGRYKSENIKHPWFAEHLYHSKGWPRQNVINKWSNEITIGIDWPAYGLRAKVEQDQPSRYSEGLEEYYPVIEEQILALVPIINEVTGLPVRYISPEDPKDKTEKYARIRIVPIRHTNLKNNFKTLRWTYLDPSPYSPTFRKSYESELWDAVPFTPGYRSQVDGYILPNPDNTINMAVCKIVPFLDKKLVQALVSECLVRALGIPDVSNLVDHALLGHWNKANDKYSKLPSLDGRKESVKYEDGSRSIAQNSEQTAQTNNEYVQVQVVTPFDRFMLSLLYCETIKPGMDKYDVIEALAKNKMCFH